MNDRHDDTEQGIRTGALLGRTGRVPGHLPRLSDVLRHVPHLGFRRGARILGEVLGDAQALRSHLKLSHCVYAETTLTLKKLIEMHECEHQDPSWPYTRHLSDHEHESARNPNMIISDELPW